jgi:hypothetical protein
MLVALAALATTTPKILMAHYMPWFESKPVSGSWGWHWTMGKTDPDQGEIAAHDHPLIGPYDSGDPALAEYHVLLMKFAGFDGIFIDWYGIVDHFDYLSNHRHAELIASYAAKAGLKFAVVYEDATVNQLIAANKFKKDAAVAEGAKVMKFLGDHWFRRSNYLRLDGRPVMLVFGPQYYQSDDWTAMFQALDPKPAFFTLHHRRDPAIGAYDWPLPKDGLEGVNRERAAFYERAKAWPEFIAAAYPQFHDFYHEAGVHDSWGNVPDRDGETYRETLTQALGSRAKIVQVATWNDWGEGTEIEPSIENGYRYLEMTQGLCRRNGKSLPYSADDLKLPIRLYRARKAAAGDAAANAKLDQTADLLLQGNTAGAAKLLPR